MMNQLGFEANEVGAEAVAHDGVRSFQFEAGDQLWLDRDVDQNRMSEDAGDRFAASLHFLRGDRTGNRQTDRSAIRAERCPGSLRELRQSRRNAVDKGGNARLMRARADRVVNRVRTVGGNVLVFSSGHILRVLAARRLGLEPAGGRYFLLAPPVSASLDTSTTSPSRLSGCGTTPVIGIEREHDHS